MKYLINIPESYVIRSPLKGEVLGIPLLVSATQKTYTLPTEIQLEPYTEPDRKTIEDEVWEFAKKIGSFNGLAKRDLEGCFGHTTIQGVMTTYDTYREAKTKYEAWKAEKDKICVGDEVKHRGLNYVVGYVGADKVYHLIDKNWLRTVVQGGYQLIKTGRHFPEVAELMKKMRELDD